MSDNKENVPKIRFPGFTGAWEWQRLGDVLKYEQPTKYIVGNTEYDDNFPTPVLTAGKSFILGFTNETNGIKDADKNNPVIIFDDFTTSSHYVDFSFKVKSSALKLLTKKETNDDLYFIYNMLKNIKYTPQGHERHWISKFSEFNILIPTIDEQIQIGTFFKQLDNLITFHQRRLKNIQKLKKGLLQKMFPKKGEKFPEVRFPGFTGAWGQHKLSDGTSKIGDGIHGTPKYTDDGDVYFVNGNNLVNGEIIIKEETKRVTTNEQTKDDRALDVNTLLMSINGTIGNLAWYKGEKLMLGKSTAYIKVSDFDKKFIYAYLQTDGIRNYFLNNLTGTTIKNLGLKTIRETKLFVPESREQSKVGSFFANLDDLITLHQRKLEHLQEQKKALLQQMFV